MSGTLRVIDHPLVQSRLSVMREEHTDKATFRSALAELSTMLVYEALRDAETEKTMIRTPVAPAEAVELKQPIIFVPILRAGLGMLEPATKLVPAADIGFVGMARNEDTHEPDSYLESLPNSLAGRHVIVLDPMLATGGSLISCLEALRKRDAEDITVVCVLAAPEGMTRVAKYDQTLNIITASVDTKLDENAYIVPGLGDAGDRQFGAV